MRTLKSIVIIDGHPDSAPDRFIHALTGAYASGARETGHRVDVIEVAKLEFPLLRTAEDFEHGRAPPTIVELQRSIKEADHLLILFPLWLGAMPALLKGLFEQLFRPGFAFAYGSKGFPKKLLSKKSAHIVVTMGMPGLFYRWYYRAHSLKSLERNILNFAGIAPVRSTVIGMMGSNKAAARAAWLKKLTADGRRAK